MTGTTGPTVTTVGVRHRDEVADVLAAAFLDDPVFRWLLPDGDDHHDDAGRARRLRRFFALEGGRRALPHGVSVAATRPGHTELTGAALVLPPGHAGLSTWFQVRHGLAYARVFGRHLARAGRYADAMARVHPSGPHVYLFAIGVRPGAQGQGVATTMLAPTLRHCDERGLPAYLEASSPDSARLYRRLGFVTDDVLVVGDAPPVELMTRPPR